MWYLRLYPWIETRDQWEWWLLIPSAGSAFVEEPLLTGKTQLLLRHPSIEEHLLPVPDPHLAPPLTRMLRAVPPMLWPLSKI